MPKVDVASLPVRTGSSYPAALAGAVAGRTALRVGDAGGLTQFGANIVTLAPGAKSSLRHWHVKEDEFVIVLSGDLTLIEDDGPTPMHPGDCAAFPANSGNGHHFVNLSDAPGTFLVVGTKAKGETAHYPDDDLRMQMTDAGMVFTHKDGTPYPPADR